MERGIEMPRYASVLAVVILLMAVLVLPAHAQSWSSAKTSGITLVESALDTATNTYTWTLTNGSDRPGMPYSIIWTLQPFNVPAPISHTEPTGWGWKSSGWEHYEVAASNKKYYTPPSIAPGQSVVFTYTFAPTAPKINRRDDSDAIGFLSHVAQVEPGSGSLDGSKKWTSADNPVYGQTWFDRSTITPDPEYPPVPEPASLIALGFGLASLTSLVVRRRRA
jgi:hypothetical protein